MTPGPGGPLTPSCFILHHMIHMGHRNNCTYKCFPHYQFYFNCPLFVEQWAHFDRKYLEFWEGIGSKYLKLIKSLPVVQSLLPSSSPTLTRVPKEFVPKKRELSKQSTKMTWLWWWTSFCGTTNVVCIFVGAWALWELCWLLNHQITTEIMGTTPISSHMSRVALAA